MEEYFEELYEAYPLEGYLDLPYEDEGSDDEYEESFAEEAAEGDSYENDPRSPANAKWRMSQIKAQNRVERKGY